MSLRQRLSAAAVGALVLAVLPAVAADAAKGPEPRFVAETPTRVSGERGPVLDLGKGTQPELYIVQLKDPAVPTRSTLAGKGTAPSLGKAAYRQRIIGQQAGLKSSIAAITGAPAKVRFSYTNALNGIAVELTREQALKVSRLDDVAAVQVDFTRTLMTDRGPEWIGAPGIWDGSDVPNGTGTKGEGVIVGVLDTGINPANPSFADTVSVADGGDGYDNVNPWGSGIYAGVCDPAQASYVADWGCNDKLIGYWNFSGADKYDDDGHGSHTASTSAGNQVEATTYSAKGTPNEFSWTGSIKGVAPHANIVAYDVCDGSGCQGASILAGIDHAISDGVDVINYSIGSPDPSAPWESPDAVGYLNARAAGIYVATSAGNDGPGAATVGSPADVPWITSVGASSHDRQWQSQVTDITDGAATLPDISGLAFSKGLTTASPLVNAATLGNPLCEAGKFSNPSAVAGKIMVCLRGTNGRVEKGEVVADLGAAGMVLANDQASGTSLNADPHALPAAHISYAAGQTLLTWLGAHPGATAKISGGIEHIGTDVADIMAAFSSRGPDRALPIVTPSVTAPGVDILAAAGTGNEVKWEFISGTSMASPHTAGSYALIKAAQPGWTPAEAQSALMSTAKTAITDSDGTPADPFDMGSGRIDLTKVTKAGLLLDESPANYAAADPTQGGDVRTLNLASMADDQCLASCGWTRTFTGTATGVGTWTAQVTSDSPDLSLALDATSFSITAGSTQTLAVTATIAPGTATDTWLFGELELTPPGGSTAPVQHLPIAVRPANSVLPTSIDITTRRDAGSQVTDGLRSIAVTDLDVAAAGLVPEDVAQISAPLDTTNDDPFDGNGTSVTDVTVPAGAVRFSARLDNATAPDFDLYVGAGPVSAANVVCDSTTAGSHESCDIANPPAGTWWVLVQNWEATSTSAPDTADLATAVVTGDEGNLRAEGPTGAVPAGTPYSLRTFFDEAAMEADQTWVGALSLGTDPASPGDIGVVPVTVHRVADDVTKSANVSTAKPGDTITYTVDVAGNVTPNDLDYTVTDTLPAGTTYVPGSATGGATFSNGTISWSSTLPTSVGDAGNYAFTTSAQDPSCDTPFGGYLDLEELNVPAIPQITGDTEAFSAFSSLAFPLYDQAETGLRFTDDGFLFWGDGYGGDPWTPQAVPDTAAPNNLAAPFWQDMEFRYSAAGNQGVSLASDPDSGFAVIEYDDMRAFGDAAGAGGTLDFEVMALAGSHDLWFAYDNIVPGDGSLLDGVTIGTENATGTQADALINAADAADTLSDGLVVCATYAPPVATTASFSYQVTVDPGVADGTALVNHAEHTTDNPGAKPATASTTVTVSNPVTPPGPVATSTTLGLNPASIAVGGSTTATATVTAPGVTPTGSVQFLAGGAVLGTGTLDAAGKATATLGGFTTAGTVALTAKYLGDAKAQASTSAPVNLVVTASPGPVTKVASTVAVKAKKTIKVGARATVRVAVTAPGVTPSGTISVAAKLGKKKKTYTLTLDAQGQAKVKLFKAKKAGKIKVTATYAGDAATLAGTGQATIKVKKRKK